MILASAHAVVPYLARASGAPYYRPGLLTDAGCDALWGTAPLGAARFEGAVVDGVFGITKPIMLGGYTVSGERRCRSASLKLLSRADVDPAHAAGVAYDSETPRPNMAVAWPGSGNRLEGLALDANGRALNGAKFDHANHLQIDDLTVVNALEVGVLLYQCQAMGASHRVRSHGSGGTGIVVDGCNGLSAYGWEVQGSAGDGIQILGSGVYQGDMAFDGLRVEGCGGNAVTVRGHDIPVALTGRLRVESCSGHGLVLDNSRVVISGAPNVRAGGDVMHITGQSDVTISGPMYVDCTTAGKEPTISIERGCAVRGLDHVRSYDGRAIRIVRQS